MPKLAERMVGPIIHQDTDDNSGGISDAGQTASDDMVLVSAGTFMMGSSIGESGRNSDELQHQVTISKGFYMSKYEITQAEWKAVMGSNPSYFKGDDLPVEGVSWYDAVAYCNALSEKMGLTPAYTIAYSINKTIVMWNRDANGYRLPTEAEWEYACRAGTTTAYYSGDRVVSAGWYDSNSGGRTHPGGEKKENAFGLYDMHGNVWEWCWDWYGDYDTSSLADPDGATSGGSRVLRGGSWNYDAKSARSAIRNRENPNADGGEYVYVASGTNIITGETVDGSYFDYRNSDYGFRVVRTQFR
jgi:formylglycine-generating enzyme required for sulfatase activity